VAALIVLAMMFYLNGRHPIEHYLPPKHDICSGYKGGSRHQHFSGKPCGQPYGWDKQ
jgi:hypothetical protein